MGWAGKRLRAAAVALAATGCALAGGTHAGAATPGAPGCDRAALGTPTGSTKLIISVPHIDQASVETVTRIRLSAAWPLADDLLTDPAGSRFQAAYTCLLPDSPPPTGVTGDIAGGAVSVSFTTVQPLSTSFVYLGWPWSADGFQNIYDRPWYDSSPGYLAVTVNGATFGLSPAPPPIYWRSVTVMAPRLAVTDTTPSPDSQSGDWYAQWQFPGSASVSRISFDIDAGDLLNDLLVVQQNDGYTDLPYEVEAGAFAVIIGVLLLRRRSSPPTRAETVVRSLSWLFAAQSVALIVADLSELGAVGGPIGNAINKISGNVGELSLLGICVFAIFRGQLVRAARRLWAAGLAALGLVTVFAGPQYFYGGTLANAFANFVSSGTLTSIGDYCAIAMIFLGWFLVCYCIAVIAGRTVSRRLLVACGAIALAVWAAVLVIGLRTGSAANAMIACAPAVRMLLGCLVTFGVIRVVAEGRDRREPPLLLDRGDRRLVAVALGFAILQAQPQSYVGVRFGAVAILTVAAAWLILSVSQRYALVGGAADRLRGYDSAALARLQQQLASAADQLEAAQRAFKALPPALTGPAREQRAELGRQLKELRCWPRASPPDDPGERKRMIWLAFFRRRERPPAPATEGDSFPRDAGPADMAMALGPRCSPLGNVSAAAARGAALTLIPVCYYAGLDASAGSSNLGSALTNPSLPVLTAAAQELTFWLLPVLVLALAWSALAGRRGPFRAVQIGLAIGVPLACGAAINQALDQSGAAAGLLRALLLLVVLMLAGLWLDLLTVRHYRTGESFAERFQGYIRLNGVAAVVTVLVPLLTAGLTVWGQVETGALTQKPAQSQSTGTPSPAKSSPPPKAK